MKSKNHICPGDASIYACFRELSKIKPDSSDSVSGMSYLHPHLRAACRLYSIQEVSFSILNGQEPVFTFTANRPLLLAIQSLKDWFFELLRVEKMDSSEIEDAVLMFYFPEGIPDSDFCAHCRVTISTKQKVMVVREVDYLGNRVVLNKRIENHPLRDFINSLFPRNPEKK